MFPTFYIIFDDFSAIPGTVDGVDQVIWRCRPQHQRAAFGKVDPSLTDASNLLQGILYAADAAGTGHAADQ